jgi:hypothetical protein
MLQQLTQLGMAQGATAPAAPNLPDGVSADDALLFTMRPNPGGSIIYYRVN